MASSLDVALEPASGLKVQGATTANAHPATEFIWKSWIERGRSRAKRVPLAELLLFTRQLGAMLGTHITLIQSLVMLEAQMHSQTMRDVIRKVRTRIEGGSSLAEALAKHPRVFNRLYIAMVTCGETAGLLPEILTRLTSQLANTARLRSKIKSAVMYPTVVVIVALLIAGFLLTYVVPVFAEVFRTFGSKLPAPTQFLLNLSSLAKYYLVIFLMAGAGVFYLWSYFVNTPFGRYCWDSWRIRLPHFGDLAHKICLARFTRNLASLVRSGVPILEALQIVSHTVGNVVMEKAVQAVVLDIERGQTFSTALSKHPVFPDMITRMVACGEATGEVDVMLEQISEFLEEEVEVGLAGLTTVIEPLLIVFLGVTMGGMVICMFLPIFKLPEIIGRQ